MAENEPTPIACTLSAGELKTRMTWIANLNKTALKELRRDGLKLALAYELSARDDVLQMVRDEEACCSFLTFAVQEELSSIRVIIEVPEAVRNAADEVFAPFLPQVSQQKISGCSCCGAKV